MRKERRKKGKKEDREGGREGGRMLRSDSQSQSRESKEKLQNRPKRRLLSRFSIAFSLPFAADEICSLTFRINREREGQVLESQFGLDLTLTDRQSSHAPQQQLNSARSEEEKSTN